MNREILILSIVLPVSSIFLLTSSYSWGGQPQTDQMSLAILALASTNSPTPNSLPKNSPQLTPPPACTNHGGVDCTAISPNGFTICKDGAIEESRLIYSVPECRKIIDDLSKKESDLMSTTGCFPPSEMTCFNEQSYQNLKVHLDSLKLINSELGREELAQCRRDVNTYKMKLNNYEQCLSENNTKPFTLAGDRFVLPILKTIFCPFFYGSKASYDSDADLCLCDKGYFMSNEQCIDAKQICQNKYGPNSTENNGNCLCSDGFQFNQNHTSCVSKTAPERPAKTPPATAPSLGSRSYPRPSLTPKTFHSSPPSPEISPLLSQRSSSSPNTSASPSSIARGVETGMFKKIVNSIALGIKNILKLF